MKRKNLYIPHSITVILRFNSEPKKGRKRAVSWGKARLKGDKTRGIEPDIVGFNGINDIPRAVKALLSQNKVKLE